MTKKTIILGITGGIAAYKSCELVRLFRKEEWEVHCVLTRGACSFVAPLTLESLSQNPVKSEILNDPAAHRMEHITLARKADVVLVAPATADFIARYAAGLANDFLTTLLLATQAPVMLAPSMNQAMLAHPAVRQNLKTLSTRGVILLPAEEGELACGEEGEGRLLAPVKILSFVKEKVLSH